MTGANQWFRPQDFAEALGKTGRAKNFSKEEQRGARVFLLRNGAQGMGEFGVRAELIGTGEEPGIHTGVGHAQFGLQFAGIAWGTSTRNPG